MTVVVTPPQKERDVIVVPHQTGGNVVVTGEKSHKHPEYVLGEGVTHVRKVTQDQYEALDPPHPTTLYLIVQP